jgi:hypothetical protein
MAPIVLRLRCATGREQAITLSHSEGPTSGVRPRGRPKGTSYRRLDARLHDQMRQLLQDGSVPSRTAAAWHVAHAAYGSGTSPIRGASLPPSTIRRSCARSSASPRTWRRSPTRTRTRAGAPTASPRLPRSFSTRSSAPWASSPGRRSSLCRPRASLPASRTLTGGGGQARNKPGRAYVSAEHRWSGDCWRRDLRQCERVTERAETSEFREQIASLRADGTGQRSPSYGRSGRRTTMRPPSLVRHLWQPGESAGPRES